MLRSWLEPEAWDAYEESQRMAAAMRDIAQGGAGVLVQHIEQELTGIH